MNGSTPPQESTKDRPAKAAASKNHNRGEAKRIADDPPRLAPARRSVLEVGPIDLLTEETSTVEPPRYSFTLVVPIFLVGLAFFSYGVFAAKDGHESPWWTILAKEAGAVIMVVAVVHLIYEVYIHRVLHNDIRRLGVTVQRLQRTVSIVGGAIESGLSAVYSSRDEVNLAMSEQMDRMKPRSSLKILGISCGAFLCPHGALHGSFRRVLGLKDVTIEALLLDIKSDAAIERARIEEPHIFVTPSDPQDSRNRYDVTRCHNELKTATDFSQDLADRCYMRDTRPGIESDQQRMAPTEPPVLAQFSYKVYSTAPLCYLVIFEDCMFLETYHNAGRGGEAPMLKIARHSGDSPDDTSLFKIYQKHFDKMRELSRDRAEEIGGTDRAGDQSQSTVPRQSQS